MNAICFRVLEQIEPMTQSVSADTQLSIVITTRWTSTSCDPSAAIGQRLNASPAAIDLKSVVHRGPPYACSA